MRLVRARPLSGGGRDGLSWWVDHPVSLGFQLVVTSSGRSLAHALGTISAVLVLTGCGSDAAGVDDEAGIVAGVEIAEASVVLEVGSTTTLEARVLGADGDPLEGRSVSWSSNRPDVVATSAEGRIEARAPGSAGVRASSSGAFDEVEVTVVHAADPDSPAPTGVRSAVLSDSEIEIEWTDTPGETEFVVERELLTFAPAEVGIDTLVERTEVARLPADTRSFVDEGLLPGRTYRHVVRACSDTGCFPEPGEDPGASGSPPVMTDGPLEIITSFIPDGFIGRAFAEPLLVAGGDGSYVWSVAEGWALPPGLTLNRATGLISGFPEGEGDFQTVFVVQSDGESDTQLVLSYFAIGGD